MKAEHENAPTAFAQRLYGLLRQIPPGRVVTYKALAEAAGCRSARAVGQALKRNPDAPAVPCHRVIRSDGRIGGYQGSGTGAAPQRKLALLRAEGVEFRDGKLAEPACLVELGEFAALLKVTTSFSPGHASPDQLRSP